MTNLSIIKSYVQSSEAFPVPFNEFWVWCEYARKDNAKRILEQNFTQDADYQVFRRNAENPKGGRPSETIMLSIDCAKSFAMLAQTQKGKEVRQYFIECEKELLTQKTAPPTFTLNREIFEEMMEVWLKNAAEKFASQAELDEWSDLFEDFAFTLCDGLKKLHFALFDRLDSLETWRRKAEK